MSETWQASEPASRDFGGPAAPIQTVQITVVSGSVDVVAHPSAGAARVDVHAVAGAPLTAVGSGPSLRIEQLKDDQGQIWGLLRGFLPGETRASTRLTVAVPAGAKVTVRAGTADVLVGGLGGDVTVQAGTGDVTLDRLTGRVDVTTGSGAIDGNALSGELKAKTATGNVTIQDAALRSAKLGTMSGASVLDITRGPTLVTANTMSGDVTVRMPELTGFDVHATSKSGHVVVDGSALVGDDGSPGGHRHEGDRSVAVKARTISGNVVVLRGEDVQDRPPGSATAGFPGPVVAGPHPGTVGAQDTPRGTDLPAESTPTAAPDEPAPPATGDDAKGA